MIIGIRIKVLPKISNKKMITDVCDYINTKNQLGHEYDIEFEEYVISL